MEKIRTLFDREGWRVMPRFAEGVAVYADLYATEKVDGTNVRVTVRNGEYVRLEARRNPDKAQKKSGIIEPWYRDAVPLTATQADRYLWEAVENTDFSKIQDGEWSGEAVGPKVQGNPLGFDEHTVILFSDDGVRGTLARRDVPVLEEAAPEKTFLEVEAFLRTADSIVRPGHPPEGLVWWTWDPEVGDFPVAKIKRKDFPD